MPVCDGRSSIPGQIQPFGTRPNSVVGTSCAVGLAAAPHAVRILARRRTGWRGASRPRPSALPLGVQVDPADEVVRASRLQVLDHRQVVVEIARGDAPDACMPTRVHALQLQLDLGHAAEHAEAADRGSGTRRLFVAAAAQSSRSPFGVDEA